MMHKKDEGSKEVEGRHIYDMMQGITIKENLLHVEAMKTAKCIDEVMKTTKCINCR
jgi:hypothetical protein